MPYDLARSIDYPTNTEEDYSSVGIIEGWGRSRVTQDTIKYQLTQTELSGTTTRQQVSENIFTARFGSSNPSQAFSRLSKIPIKLFYHKSEYFVQVYDTYILNKKLKKIVRP